MYAVVEDRNQQYRVQPGDRIQIHLHEGAQEGGTLTFDKVCLVGGEGAGRIGAPYVAGVKVTAKVLRPNIQADKVVIGKFRRRKNSRRRNGFRARYTEIQIEAILA
ncbi:MAG: 50S ribosomal protein L21 [Planctomycetota bacterium]|jgi:large subunit ribosomal protein L21